MAFIFFISFLLICFAYNAYIRNINKVIHNVSDDIHYRQTVSSHWKKIADNRIACFLILRKISDVESNLCDKNRETNMV